MIYGITGNPNKNQLWSPVAELVAWLMRRDLSFCLHQPIAAGLIERDLVDATLCQKHSSEDLTRACDVVLSFGGDGTLLRSAHDTGPNDTPLLGVNIGRLGFLADIEVGHVVDAIKRIEEGDFTIEKRMVLEARLDGPEAERLNGGREWALNEFVLDRSGAAGLIRIEVEVDDEPLNTYWADGLILSTPTGSTAYSLSTGGPIIVPGCDAIILTPIAPHTLTVRPIVLPASVTIKARVLPDDQPYVLAADGRSLIFDEHGMTITVKRASHTVNLIKLPGQHYFKTIRSKLMWGVRSTMDDRDNGSINGKALRSDGSEDATEDAAAASDAREQE